jgi:murein DD-endopeptidase MepM/ murein hydrolase activator NlpD
MPMAACRRALLRVARTVALLAPVALVAALPAHPAAAARPVPAADPAPPKVMGVDAWIKVLPAPQMPETWAPPPGPRVAWPMRGMLTQPFGCTGYELEHPTTDCPGGFHTGVDIAQPPGTPIRAAAAGLAYPLQDPARYGNFVIVQHLGGYATVYAHMTRFDVAWGQRVQAADVIGFVGSTGNSSGPHLHFEVRFTAAAYDPMPYLAGQPPDPAPVPAGWPGAPRDDWLGRR